MLQKTNAIVLSKIKYGERDLIVTCFTKQRGLSSYLLRGILKSGKGKLKAAYFQPLSQLLLDEQYNPKSSLHTIKEVKVEFPYTTLHTNVIKSTITLFLSETLHAGLKQEDNHEALYEYITTSLQWLDHETQCANFHLLFLLKLTRYLGFYPEVSNANKPYFNLSDGKFEVTGTSPYSVEGETVEMLVKLLESDFESISNLKFNASQRQGFLNTLMLYYELHLPGFKKPKSLDILHQLFKA